MCIITEDKLDHVDKYGCSAESYKNASGNFENYIRDNLNFTQEQVQNVVNKTLAFVVENAEFARKSVSKDMSLDNPYSEFYSVVF